jgi:Spy/CpxP family protein refolding chaperone
MLAKNLIRRKKMKKVLVVVCAVVFLMVWVGFSDAAPCEKCMGDMGKGMGDGMDMEGMLRGMDSEHMDHIMMGELMSMGIDERTMEDIKAIHLKCNKDAIKKKADIEVAEIELRELLDKDPVDLAAAEAKIKEMAALKADLKIEHMKSMEEIKGKLTPEQRRKFHALVITMHMGGMGMEGMHHEMRGGGKGMSGGKCIKCGKCGMMRGMEHSGDGRSEMPTTPEENQQKPNQ